jgi:hypothetical protein
MDGWRRGFPQGTTYLRADKARSFERGFFDGGSGAGYAAKNWPHATRRIRLK